MFYIQDRKIINEEGEDFFHLHEEEELDPNLNFNYGNEFLIYNVTLEATVKECDLANQKKDKVQKMVSGYKTSLFECDVIGQNKSSLAQ